MARQDAGPKTGQVTVEDVNHPGLTTNVEGTRYHAMRNALLKVLPPGPPGLTQNEFQDAVVTHLPHSLFPGGEKAGWWSKTVQLDLEAKGLVVREKVTPLRWHRKRG